jgi:hypothetical protein
MEDGFWLSEQEKSRLHLLRKERVELIKKANGYTEKLTKKTITDKENEQRLRVLKRHQTVELEIKEILSTSPLHAGEESIIAKLDKNFKP